ncbi:MAG: nucleotide-binding protein [Niabella sp.]|nr:nucleotide-binding protein [Niabella sp.]
MDIQELKELLVAHGFLITGEKDISNGTQLRLSNSAIVNLFNTGKINVQGQNSEPVKHILGLNTNQPISYKVGQNTARQNATEVFVVYGHDADCRTQLEAMLRRWNLKPLILDQLPSEGQTIIEKLEKYTSTANFCIVLATPDDEGYRKDHEDEKAFRARQNVVLELGMMLSMLGRDKVAILLKDQINMERPSDIQGLIYIPFKDDVKEAALTLAKEMVAKGYEIDIKDL